MSKEIGSTGRDSLLCTHRPQAVRNELASRWLGSHMSHDEGDSRNHVIEGSRWVKMRF